IQRIAGERHGVYDLSRAAETVRDAHRRRLVQLEQSKLAERLDGDRWKLSEAFLRGPSNSPPRPVWIREGFQPLDEQRHYNGPVWLDSVRADELAATGYGADVRDALRAREAHLRGLGLDPAATHLKWKLRDFEQHELEVAIAASTGRVPQRASQGFEGSVHLHRRVNGERFVEVRGSDQFVVIPATRQHDRLEGTDVSLDLGPNGRVSLVGRDHAERQRGVRQGQALAQVLAAAPAALRHHVVDGGAGAQGAPAEL